VVPSPNDHSHELGELVELSAKWTVSGEVPELVSDENATTGADSVSTLMKLVSADWLLPTAFVDVSCTVYVPG
jgi:hypothetical protein